MASYVLLFHYTHQGIEHVKQSPDRVDALRKIFDRHGAKLKDFYALLGQYDSLFIVEAPNDETVAKLALYIAEQGNVRVETHRAFTEAEFRKLLSEIDYSGPATDGPGTLSGDSESACSARRSPVAVLGGGRSY